MDENPYQSPATPARKERRQDRFVLIATCLVGTAVAAMLGLPVAILTDSMIVAWLLSAAIPCTALWLVGLRSGGQLAKIAIYALLGWIVCRGLEPTISEVAASRVRRIAQDPLAGKGWYIACFIFSAILTSVGAAFVPLRERNNP